MKAEQLRASILQQAIQGKLVVQNENDEPASVLIDKIKAEKKKLIEEKKIKKEKPYPPITDEEKPFELPQGWEWVRLGEIIDVRDGTHDTPKYISTGIPLVTSKNLKDGEIDFKSTRFISMEDAEKINQRSAVEDGDILFAMIGSIGNPIIVKKTREFAIKNMALFKSINFNCTNMFYILNFLMLEQGVMKEKASGGVQSFVSLSFLRNYAIPLPPLSEQKRIVEKLEQIMPLIDEYEKLEKELTLLDGNLKDKLKNSLLQEAIRGKLVSQDQNDEPASVLIEKIKAEKEKLVEEKKIKKEKPLAPITDEEKSFEIPIGWEWIRFGELMLKVTDGAHTTPKYVASGVPFLSVKDMSSGKLDFSDTKFISEEEHKELFKRCNPELGDVLVTKIGTTGIPVIVDTDTEFSLFVSVALLKFNQDLLYNKFLVHLINTPLVKQLSKDNTRGVGNKNLVLKGLKNFPIPLPPLEEQKRIVEKLDELMVLCDKL